MKAKLLSKQIIANRGVRPSQFYPTPPHATYALLRKEKFYGTIWEPACGTGNISKVLIEAGYDKPFSSDLKDYGYGEKKDFLNPRNRKIFNNIITNPPYDIAAPFVLRALDLTTDKVAMLLRLSFIEGVRRHESIFTNKKLKSVYIFRRRISFLEKHQNTERSIGMFGHAWYVWDHGYSGKPKIDWI